MAKNSKQNNLPKTATAPVKKNTVIKPQPIAQKAIPKSAETPKKLSNGIILAIFLGALSFIIYSNTFNNKYVLDDFTVIKNNNIISKGISQIPTIFTTPYRRGWFITTNDLYRPLSLVTFAIEYQLYNGEPEHMHISNALIYMGCVMLLFFFLDAFFEQKKTIVAFIATFLFALHPIHTEVVANIKSRDELLCFFFAFLSLNIFIKYLKTNKILDLILGAFCLFLSLLSKESTITFLAIIPFVFFFYRNENKKASIFITVSAVVSTIIFLIIRLSVLKYYHADKADFVIFIDNFLVSAPLASRIATAIFILGYYIKLLFVPYPLICDYSYNSIPLVGFDNIYVILTILLIVAVSIYSIFMVFKNKKDPFAFGILFFIITISLFTNLVFIIGSAMAERFVFFCSAGFCLLIAFAIDKWVLKTNNNDLNVLKSAKALAFLIPIGIIFGGITFNRNNDWKDNLSLFHSDVIKSPNDSRLTYYLGTELATDAKNEKDPNKKIAMIKEGIENLYKSKAVYPEYNDVLSELGDAYFMIGQNDSAELYDKKAIAENPKNSLAINNLAGVYFTKRDYRNALNLTNKALEINPNYVNALSNIGLCYLHLGIFDSGVIVLRKAMCLDPNFGGSYENIALTFKAMGLVDSAKYYESRAKQTNPGFRI